MLRGLFSEFKKKFAAGKFSGEGRGYFLVSSKKFFFATARFSECFFSGSTLRVPFRHAVGTLHILYEYPPDLTEILGVG